MDDKLQGDNDMNLRSSNLVKMLAWGTASIGCYAGLFTYSTDLINLAQTTASSCLVGSGSEAVFYHKVTPELCAEKGGIFQDSNKLNVLVPIAIVFSLSIIHGAFTGLFWEVIGLRAAKKK